MRICPKPGLLGVILVALLQASAGWAWYAEDHADDAVYAAGPAAGINGGNGFQPWGAVSGVFVSADATAYGLSADLNRNGRAFIRQDAGGTIFGRGLASVFTEAIDNRVQFRMHARSTSTWTWVARAFIEVNVSPYSFTIVEANEGGTYEVIDDQRHDTGIPVTSPVDVLIKQNTYSSYTITVKEINGPGVFSVTRIPDTLGMLGAFGIVAWSYNGTTTLAVNDIIFDETGALPVSLSHFAVD